MVTKVKDHPYFFVIVYKATQRQFEVSGKETTKD